MSWWPFRSWPFRSWRAEAKRTHKRLVRMGSRLFALELEHDILETRLEKLEKLVADLLLGDAPAKARVCEHPDHALRSDSGGVWCTACGWHRPAFEGRPA